MMIKSVAFYCREGGRALLGAPTIYDKERRGKYHAFLCIRIYNGRVRKTMWVF